MIAWVYIHVYVFLICRYPPHDRPDVVVSELELWEVHSNWHSKFHRHPHYNVVLKQRDLGGIKASVTLVLYESSALDSSQQAFEEVRSTLEPLVNDGSLMLTRKLLKEIITPKPMEASRLIFELVEIMDKNVCTCNLP